MTNADLKAYFAKMHGMTTDDPRLQPVISMAIAVFSGAHPWSWARGDKTYTTDANGIITFDGDFDGTITMRERASSSGGWIHVWTPEKFDFELPRLDNLSGSYAKVCKLYQNDGVWYGQIAPPAASQTIYVLYKKHITQADEIPDKFLSGVVAVGHTFLLPPGAPGYADAYAVRDDEIRRLWKKDRQNWAGLFKMYDEETVREYVRWWGVWAW